MKVLLVKIPNNDTTTNSVIEKMATKFNCAFIEPITLSDNKYHLNKIFFLPWEQF